MLNIYRASAGSGKTYRLTQDYIHLLFDVRREHNHRRILAVTFTNKATHEMKSRILKELYLLAQGGGSDFCAGLMEKYGLTNLQVQKRASSILIDILYDYSAFSVSTIDRFFQQVIRAFAREIGVKSAYGVELDSDSVLQQSVDNLFFNLSQKENKQLLAWLTDLAEERIEEGLTWDMRGNMMTLGREIFKEKFQTKAQETKEKLHDQEFLLKFRRELIEIKNSFEIKLKGKAKEAEDLIVSHGLVFKDFTRGSMATLEKIQKGSFDLPAEKNKTFFAYAEAVERCYTKTASAEKKATIEQLYANGLQSCLLDILACLTEDIVLYNSANIVLKHLSMLGVLSDLAVQIKDLTEEQNTMLIADSGMFLSQIIDGSDTPFVYERIGVNVNNYMIDEFQDTSVLQWKNFKPLVDNSLAADNFNLVVGDVKQSIYRWRNSDWSLLDEQIMNDFAKNQILEENLDTNWRSDKNVIEFNNSFFSLAAELLQEKLNQNIASSLLSSETLSSLKDKILHAYKHLSQKTSPKAGEGYVEINFIDKEENEEGWQEESLLRLPKVLENLQDKAYVPNKVAILVRTNAEERKISQFLLNYKTKPEAKSGYCYNVMGSKGLLLQSSSSVRFIIALLKLYINPDDKIQRSIVRYEYLLNRNGNDEEKALRACFIEVSAVDGQTFIFPDEREELKLLRHRSIYEMVEQIIALFDLGNWPNQAIFVQSFQDVLFAFSQGKAADLNNFLNWWAKNSEKQCITSPEGQDAFPIMTVHSSKGLDFDAVIIPFCDWDFDSRNRNILWCETSEPIFDQIPLLPIEYSKKLSQSIFAENYFREQMSLFLDNLNVAYVAFTRAKHELICFTPLEEKTEISRMANLLYLCSNRASAAGEDLICLNNFYDAEKAQFILGESKAIAAKEKAKETLTQKLEGYPTVSIQSRLQTRVKKFDPFENGAQLADSPLIYGTVMHQLLQEIEQPSEQEQVLQRFVREGDIRVEDLKMIREALADFWAMPETAAWFNPSAKVLREATILTPEGQQYRPDRVIIEGEKVCIVDYKFGDSEKPYYIKQMQQYMQLLKQMNYEVEGFLCYVSLRRVVAV